MLARLILAFGACLVLAACSSPRYGTPATGPDSRVETGPTASTEWYNSARVPAQGFLMTDQDPLIGRNVEDREGNRVGTIGYVLYQSGAGDTTRYVTVSNRDYYGHLLVPVAGLRITQDTVWVDKTQADLLAQRHYSVAELEEHYPPTNMRRVVISPAPGLPSTALPLVGTLPPVATAPAVSAPLMLAWRGGAVGAPVYDVTGTYIGTLAAQSVEPGTGVPRYAIVSGPSIGRGYYIAVPASDAQYLNGRVMLDAPLASWQQLPHYQLGEVQQAYGALGVVP